MALQRMMVLHLILERSLRPAYLVVMMYLRLICVALLTLAVSACSRKEEPEPEAAPQVSEALPPPVPAPSPTVSTAPEVLSREMPEFPRQLAEQQVEGEVVLQFSVTETGDVTNPELISSTHPQFSESALKVISKWRFKPATADGKAIAKEKVIQRFPFIIARPQPEEYLSGDEEQPILIDVLRPRHPGMRQSGEALLSISLDRTAIVKQVEIINATGAVNSDEMIAAVRQWIFQPFQKDGEYVSTQVRAKIEFTPYGTVLVQYPARD